MSGIWTIRISVIKPRWENWKSRLEVSKKAASFLVTDRLGVGPLPKTMPQIWHVVLFSTQMQRLTFNAQSACYAKGSDTFWHSIIKYLRIFPVPGTVSALVIWQSRKQKPCPPWKSLVMLMCIPIHGIYIYNKWHIYITNTRMRMTYCDITVAYSDFIIHLVS